MKLRSVLILIILGITSGSYAQQHETIYQGTIVNEGYYDDRSWGPLPLGFNFKFYGHPYNRFYVSTNGLITFGSGTNDYSEDPIPSPAVPNNFIAAFWDDVVITPSGKILYTTIGASPNRKCIIQWTNMGFYSSTVLMGTFTVIIYEATEEIRIQYRSIIDHTSARSHGSSASIGIENSTGTSGISFSYHNPDAISSEQAVLFTPSGNGYTMDTSAIYEGVYLTKDFTLPEPGIPKLISPANNSVTNTSQTFEWAGSSNAGYYTLKISQNSDISASFDHNTGTNTSYDISDLVLNSTYYWAVFATNSTGTTWSEIYKFTTSKNPPLTAVPLTIWLDQNEERTVRLQSNGGNGSSRHATITSLPSHGSLYQYNEGVRGERITSVPCLVTNDDMNLIYLADTQPGNGVGNFSFIVTDDTGNSPEGTITVNVNPPGIPNFLLAAKSGNIEIQFDKPMMDPAGNEDQFRVTANGDQVQISGVSLKPGDPYTILVTLQTPLQGGEMVYISYTQGDVAAETGGLLPGFTDQLVSFIIQTISFPSLPVVTCDDPPITLSATSSSGLPLVFASSNTSVALVTGNELSFNSPGTAGIMALQSGNGTYAPARYIQTINVNKADQTITFNDPPPKTFGDPDFSLSAFSTSLLPVSFTSSDTSAATISGNAVHITGAGVTILTASQSGNNRYHPAVKATRRLRVEKATLTVTAADKSKIFLSPNPELAIICTGFVNGDDISVLDKQPVATTEATLYSSAGEYEIIVSGGEDHRYNFIYVNGVLQILKACQKVEFISYPERLMVNEIFPLEATASSGLPVCFESRNPDIAEINGYLVKGSGRGNAVLRAYQPGNENYEPDESEISVEVFSTHRGILNLFTPNGDGFNDFWEIPDPESFGHCEVRIFNRWGKLVFAAKDYKGDWDGRSDGSDIPAGAYYYIINSEKKGTITGTLNLIR